MIIIETYQRELSDEDMRRIPGRLSFDLAVWVLLDNRFSGASGRVRKFRHLPLYTDVE